MVTLLYGVGVALIAAGAFWIYAAFNGAPPATSSLYYAAALLAALPGFGTAAAGVVVMGLANMLATLKELLALQYREAARQGRGD